MMNLAGYDFFRLQVQTLTTITMAGMLHVSCNSHVHLDVHSTGWGMRQRALLFRWRLQHRNGLLECGCLGGPGALPSFFGFRSLLRVLWVFLV